MVPVAPFVDLTALWIQVTGTWCNLQCRHCLNASGPRDPWLAPLAMDTVRAAIAELGDNDGGSDRIVQFVAERFGVAVGAKFVPVYRATIRGEAELVRAHERAAAILADDEKTREAGRCRARRTASIENGCG